MQTYGLRTKQAKPEHFLAIFHLSVKTVSRSTGRSAVAAAAYRAGERLTNEADGAAHDYGRRRGVTGRTLLVPDGAGGLATLAGAGWRAERERLWNAAEAAERRVNSTVAREYELALPAELDAAGRQALAVGFAREVVSRFGVAADVAVHAPSREGNERNHHAHILTTTRVVGAGGALGAKTRELDDKKTGPAHVEALRELWAIQVNHALQRIEAAARVDHRSHARRGLDAVPSITMGAGATALERRAQRAHDGRDGGPDALPPVTRRGQRQAAIAAANAAAELARAEAEAAQAEQQEREAEAARAARELAERRRAETARPAVQPPRRAVEGPSPVPGTRDTPRPVQAPQRPSEAAHAARVALGAMVRKARGDFLDEGEAEEAERVRRAAAARMEAEQRTRADAARTDAARAAHEPKRRQAESAGMAVQPPRKAVDAPLPAAAIPHTPRPVQAPQRLSEAAQAIDPDKEWWRAMPMAALQAEVERLRPWPVEKVVELLPRVQAEREAADQSLTAAAEASKRAWQAERNAGRAEQEIEATRAEPGVLARLRVWLHDQGLRPNAALAQQEAALAKERRRQARALEAAARHQAEAKAAQDREQAAKAAGLPEAEAMLRPMSARHEAALAVWWERTAAQYVDPYEQANANQRRVWAQEAEELRREAEERERLQAERAQRAAAARNAAEANAPEPDRAGDAEELGWHDDPPTP